MSVVGFIDDSGAKIRFADVIAGAGDFRTRRGAPVPRPLLRLLARQYRDTSEHYGSREAVSATELIAPTQIRVLLDRHEVFVRPLDNLWAAYGALMHLLLESAQAQEEAPDFFRAEQRYLWKQHDLPRPVAGTIDFLEREGDGWHGWDYKVMSSYGVRQMVFEGVESKPEYLWQANIYAWLLRMHEENVLDWRITAICRDWTERAHGKHIGPVEVIEVPLKPVDEVEAFVRERLTLLEAAQMCDDGGLPHCSPEETWGGKRCESHCPVAAHCVQIHPELDVE